MTHAHVAASRSHRIAVLSISDSRSAAFDVSGDLAVELLRAAGHEVTKTMMRDEADAIAAFVRGQLVEGAETDAIVTVGGTGIAPRDVTIEAIATLIVKKLDGFGELFRMLSYQQVGAAAMLSRATAGTVGRGLVFVLPGSPGAVRLAIDKLIVPELSHALGLLTR